MQKNGRRSKLTCVGESAGSISTADGSALVRMGETTVVCGVKAEIAEPELDREGEGFLGVLFVFLLGRS